MQPFQLSFSACLEVDFQGSRVTSDGGLILVRELDERLGLGELIEPHLTDPRRGQNTRFPLADLLRQPFYSRLAGYEAPAPADRLGEDPAAWRGSDLPVADVRDRDADCVRKLPRLGANQLRTHRQSRSTAPATGTSSPPAITRRCCSTASGTVGGPSCGPATCTALILNSVGPRGLDPGKLVQLSQALIHRGGAEDRESAQRRIKQVFSAFPLRSLRLGGEQSVRSEVEPR